MQYEFVEQDISEELLGYFTQRPVISVDTELTGLNLHRDRVCTIQISDGFGKNVVLKTSTEWVPERVSVLLENSSVRKVFHHAVVDVCMLAVDQGISVKNFRCTKIMSKLVRTYTDRHSLKDLFQELLGVSMDKTVRESCWFADNLSDAQLKYAIQDVVRLLEIYEKLEEMLKLRGTVRSGISCEDLNESAQSALANHIPLLISGFGSPDNMWDVSNIFRY